MKQQTHYIQDACEKLVVALIQLELEKHGKSVTNSSKSKYGEFLKYIAERDLDISKLKNDEYFKASEIHIPSFVETFLSVNADVKYDVVDTEVAGRIQNLKTDFAFLGSDGSRVDYSLKNYKGGIRRPQVCSGTFNSFICNFLFKQSGVGMYEYSKGKSNIRFKGSIVPKRDAALIDIGYGSCIPLLHKLDEMQQSMRKRVLENPEMKIFDESKWKSLCTEVGNFGAETTLKLFQIIDKELITNRILKSTGIVGNEELLAITKSEYLDSFTNRRFHKLRKDLLDEKIVLDIVRVGQSINFIYSLNKVGRLKVTVPFTINSNGAWHRDVDPYEGRQTINDKGNLVSLRYGELRPYKSREIATSINTYLELTNTGIFDEI